MCTLWDEWYLYVSVCVHVLWPGIIIKHVVCEACDKSDRNTKLYCHTRLSKFSVSNLVSNQSASWVLFLCSMSTRYCKLTVTYLILVRSCLYALKQCGISLLGLAGFRGPSGYTTSPLYNKHTNIPRGRKEPGKQWCKEELIVDINQLAPLLTIEWPVLEWQTWH